MEAFFVRKHTLALESASFPLSSLSPFIFSLPVCKERTLALLEWLVFCYFVSVCLFFCFGGGFFLSLIDQRCILFVRTTKYKRWISPKSYLSPAWQEAEDKHSLSGRDQTACPSQLPPIPGSTVKFGNYKSSRSSKVQTGSPLLAMRKRPNHLSPQGTNSKTLDKSPP